MTGPLVDLNGRVRDRAREARRRRVRLVAVLIGTVVLVAGLAWAATASPLFSVRKVNVTGNNRVPTETITQAAAIQAGVPLAQVDVAAASKRLSALPAIGRGDVTIALPDTVNIRVTERQIAFVVAVDGGFALVDPTGVRFDKIAERPAGVPLAEVNAEDRQLLADVATVVGALPERITAKVQRVTAQTRDSIIVVTGENTKIVGGSADSSSLKGQVADTLTTAQPACAVVDVSSPTHPTTRC